MIIIFFYNLPNLENKNTTNAYRDNVQCLNNKKKKRTFI